MTDNHYECEICHGVNSAVRIHCQFCETIPAKYSWTGNPIRERLPVITYNELGNLTSTIRVFVAFGVDRQCSRRTIKRAIRTVPMDYYATE